MNLTTTDKAILVIALEDRIAYYENQIAKLDGCNTATARGLIEIYTGKIHETRTLIAKVEGLRTAS